MICPDVEGREVREDAATTSVLVPEPIQAVSCPVAPQVPNPAVGVFEGLSPPYSTIVADPPWHYAQGGPTTGWGPLRRPPYSSMTVAEIAAMPVGDLAAGAAFLFLWTTNAYLRAAFEVAESWGFRHSQTLTWCKPPRGIGPGGTFSNTTEFVLYCRRGVIAPSSRIDRTHWTWPRGAHSVKPDAFSDLVEQVAPGPYLEMFARAPRLGWDSWGHGYESPTVGVPDWSEQ